MRNKKKKDRREYTQEEQAAIDKAKKIPGSVLLCSYEQLETLKIQNLLREVQDKLSNTDEYSEYEDALYHKCEKLKRYNPYTGMYEIGKMPFSSKSKEYITHCPVCQKLLNWDTNYHI
jgi:ElaB/YqjD/DUF883 family membrane-anchored ribosome-binding protein